MRPHRPAQPDWSRIRETYPLNNIRGNNRRRGRGNRQNSGGGQQLNRIDSRARGNAPQLLEKYRKLAQDAHLNGDRVQAEYYLQFADHYFRVIADQRQRQEEQRSRPQGERWQDESTEGDDAGEFSAAGDFPTFEQPSFNRQQRAPRQAQDDRGPSREEREEPAERVEEVQAEEGGDANPYEPAENPFVRENRPRTGLRPRREREERRPRRETRDADGDEPVGLDPASLPPAISASSGEAEAEGEAAPKPRKRVTRRKPSAGDAGEALESVS